MGGDSSETWKIGTFNTPTQGDGGGEGRGGYCFDACIRHLTIKPASFSRRSWRRRGGGGRSHAMHGCRRLRGGVIQRTAMIGNKSVTPACRTNTCDIFAQCLV